MLKRRAPFLLKDTTLRSMAKIAGYGFFSVSNHISDGPTEDGTDLMTIYDELLGWCKKNANHNVRYMAPLGILVRWLLRTEVLLPEDPWREAVAERLLAYIQELKKLNVGAGKNKFQRYMLTLLMALDCLAQRNNWMTDASHASYVKLLCPWPDWLQKLSSDTEKNDSFEKDGLVVADMFGQWFNWWAGSSDTPFPSTCSKTSDFLVRLKEHAVEIQERHRPIPSQILLSEADPPTAEQECAYLDDCNKLYDDWW